MLSERDFNPTKHSIIEVFSFQFMLLTVNPFTSPFLSLPSDSFFNLYNYYQLSWQYEFFGKLFYIITIHLRGTIKKVKLEEKKGLPIAKRIRWRLFRSLNNAMPTKFINDPNSLPRVLLFERDGSCAEVLLYGGKIVSWKNKNGEELLVMGTHTVGKSPKETKGGISVCFPQFGDVGTIQQRLSMRNKTCSLNKCPMHLIPTGSPSSVDLIFKPTNHETSLRSFELRLRVCLGPGKLSVTAYVKNCNHKSFEFMFALHNYLSVSDISEVRVEGLETLDYFDNLKQGERLTEQADAITFDGEVDRVYTQTPACIAIVDHEKKRTFVVKKKGLPDAVLWNPWEKAADQMGIMGFKDGAYKKFLALDSSVVEKPIVLKPFQEWTCYQELSIVSSSYFSGQLDPQKVVNSLG